MYYHWPFLFFGTTKRADKINGISDTFLPFTGNIHGLFIVIDYEKCCGSQFEVVFLLKVFSWPRKFEIFSLSSTFTTTKKYRYFVDVSKIAHHFLNYLLTWMALYHLTYLGYMHRLALLHLHSQVFEVAWKQNNRT